MININYDPNELRIEIDGHAGYAEEGKDIVCSAVSILFYTLAASVDAKDVLFSKGHCFLQCAPADDERAHIQDVFETVVNGFRLLAEGYPENVSLKEGGQNG